MGKFWEGGGKSEDGMGKTAHGKIKKRLNDPGRRDYRGKAANLGEDDQY